MNEVLRVENLTKAYGNTTVVKHVNLHAKAGTVIGLLGANGAGKTTTMECILGTKRQDEGTITLLGMNPRKDRKKLFERVGVQFQQANYQQEIKVNELCEETASLYKNPANWHSLLNEFGLGKKEKTLVKELSGGQCQRLFIVLALLSNPEIVFLDELTTGLDTKARRGVWRILESLKKQGLTIFLTSHFMDEVEALCDEIYILKKGEVVFQGTVREAIETSPYEQFEDAYLWYSDEEEKDEDF